MPDIVTEIFHSGAWHDISADVYNRDIVNITRGRPDETSQVRAGRMTTLLNNRDGRYSSRNPRSDLFGLIGRNTPLHVSVDGSIRFAGEVASWPQDWSSKGLDVFTQIEVAGILRRLGQGTDALDSALFRSIQRFPNIVAYWSMEDDGGASEFSSAIEGVSPMTFSGDIDLASLEAPPGSKPLPSFSLGSSFRAAVPAYIVGTNNSWNAEWLFQSEVPAVPPDSFGEGPVFGMADTLNNTLRVQTNSTTFRIEIRNEGGTTTHTDDETIHSDFYDQWLHMQLRVSGTTRFNYRLIVSDAERNILHDVSGFTGTTVPKRLTSVSFGPIGGRVRHVGHVSVGNAPFGDTIISALGGYSGEMAADRITRLAAEEDVPVTIVGIAADTAAVGAQLPKTFLDLVREAAIADQGILYEDRAILGLVYRTRVDLYNQQPAFVLNYGDGVFRSALSPIDDDQLTRNDITITRQSGSSARAVLETGALSIQPPPDGVGRYDEGLTVNLAGDGQLPNDASWRLALGTVDEARYPSLHFQLTADPVLTAQLAALDIGDRIVIDDPPEWLPPEQISVLVQGFTETVSLATRDIVINTSPESPYQVGMYEAAEGGTYRYDTAGSSLATAFDAGTDTSMSVNVDVLPLWTTAAGEFPFDIECGGVRLQVTAISGAASPQTFTITQTPINGIAKIIPAGTPVSLWTKARIAL